MDTNNDRRLAESEIQGRLKENFANIDTACLAVRQVQKLTSALADAE